MQPQTNQFGQPQTNQFGQPQQQQQQQWQQPQTNNTGQPMQVVVVQQDPNQTNTMQTTAATTNYSNKMEAIEAEYNKTEQICPIGNFMIWALVMWSIIIVCTVAWCIAGIVLIGIAAACVNEEIGDETTDNATDVVCGVGVAIGVVILIVGIYELCVCSLIVHGIRKYQHGLCIFGCIWAGLGLLACWSVVGSVAYISVSAFVLYGLTLVFTAFHTHYVGKAQQVWFRQSRR